MADSIGNVEPVADANNEDKLESIIPLIKYLYFSPFFGRIAASPRPNAYS